MLSESVRLCPGYYGGGCIEFTMNTDYCVQDERKQVASMAERQGVRFCGIYFGLSAWERSWRFLLGSLVAERDSHRTF